MEQGELRIAGPWTDDQLKALCVKLEQKYNTPTSFRISRDEALIGGFVARIDGKVVDASIKSKLNRLILGLKANR
jgi:F0F1-type ATP synthase delta subunit